MMQPAGAPLAPALLVACFVCAQGIHSWRPSDVGKNITEANHSALEVRRGAPRSSVKLVLSSGASEAAEGAAGTWQGSLFVFGYGSLMKEMSRIKTTCNLSSVSESTLDFLDKFAWVTPWVRDCIESVRKRTMILVKARGVRRGWYDSGNLQGQAQDADMPEKWALQALDISPTFLGALHDESSDCYGVVYPVNQEELALTDQREMAYGTVSPRWLHAEQIDVLTEGYGLPRGANVRWYELAKERVTRPSSQHPICQSYVDVFIGGALELATAHNRPDYAQNVVLTTHGWSQHWVNDRIVPYRPYVHESQAHKIVRTLIQAARAPNSTLTLQDLAGVQFPLARQELHEAARSNAPNVGSDSVLGLLLLLVLPWRLSLEA